MDIAIFWILLAIAVGVWASNKGRSGFGWFLLAMLLSPLLGFIFCAISQDISKSVGASHPSAETHVKCPACAEFVLPAATKCRHCGESLKPQPNYAIQRAINTDDIESKSTLITIGAWLAIGLILWLILRAK